MIRGELARSALLLPAILLLFGSGATAAEPSANLTAAQRNKATALFKKARGEYESGDYAAAIASFKASYAVAPTPWTLYALAKAYDLKYKKTGDLQALRAAAEGYQQFLRQEPDSIHSAGARQALFRAMGALLLNNAASQPARSALPQTPFKLRTELMVTSQTPGARATIDGAPRGGAPLPLRRQVKPGRHRIRVFARGFEERTRTLVAVPHRMVSANIDLSRPPPATLRVSADVSGAEVFVDGRYLGTTPLERAGLVKPGSHAVAVRTRGRQLWTRTVRVDRSGSAMKMSAHLSWTLRRKIAVGLGSATAALVVCGAITGGLALAEDSRVEDYQVTTAEQLPELDSIVRRRDGLAMASTVSFAVGLATLAAALWLYLFDTPPRPVATRLTARSRGRVAARHGLSVQF